MTWNGKPLRRPDGRSVDFTADGIALSPDGKTLYWQAIKGKTLYSLPTSTLNPDLTTPVTPESVGDASLRGKVEVVGENGPADGLIISRHNGKMDASDPQTNGIGVRDLSRQGGGPSRTTSCIGPTHSAKAPTARSSSRRRTSRIPPSTRKGRRSRCRRSSGLQAD